MNETIKIENIVLNNALYGICEISGSELQSIQNRLVEVAANNGAVLKGGILTSLIEYDAINNIAKMQIGILTDNSVIDPSEFIFCEKFTMHNVVCFSFQGESNKINEEISVFSQRLTVDENLKPTGKIYNLIEYLSKNGDEMAAKVYIEVST